MQAASGKFKGYTTEMTKNHHHHQKVDQCIDYFVLYQLQHLHGPKSLQLSGTNYEELYSICISFTLYICICIPDYQYMYIENIIHVAWAILPYCYKKKKKNVHP